MWQELTIHICNHQTNAKCKRIKKSFIFKAETGLCFAFKCNAGVAQEIESGMWDHLTLHHRNCLFDGFAPPSITGPRRVGIEVDKKIVFQFRWHSNSEDTPTFLNPRPPTDEEQVFCMFIARNISLPAFISAKMGNGEQKGQGKPV